MDGETDENAPLKNSTLRARLGQADNEDNEITPDLSPDKLELETICLTVASERVELPSASDIVQLDDEARVRKIGGRDNTQEDAFRKPHEVIQRIYDTWPLETRLQWDITHIVYRMTEVDKQMSIFEHHCRHQPGDAKQPFYNLINYQHYHLLDRATLKLDTTVEKVKLIYRSVSPNEIICSVKGDLHQALALSTSISKNAAHAMAFMEQKLKEYEKETDVTGLNYNLADSTENGAHDQLDQLIQRCMTATKAAYGGVELLKELHAEQLDTAAKSIRRSIVPSGIWSIMALLILILCAKGLFEYQAELDKIRIYTKDSIDRTGLEVYGLRHEVAGANLSDVGARLQYLEANSDEIGLRIDNLWEALGPPNADGTYYSTWAKFKSQKSGEEEINDRVCAVAQKHLGEVIEEIQNLRRHIHRVDIRLTKQLNKLGKH